MPDEPLNNKKITHSARALQRAVITGLFALVWVVHYNHYIFGLHAKVGAIIVIIAYYFIYNWLCDIYKAFRFASTTITESLLSQFISFGITDLLFYTLACVSDHQIVNIVYGVVAVVIQLAFSALIIQRTKDALMNHIVREKTLIIKGKLVDFSDAEEFIDRLQTKFYYLFDITQIISESESQDDINKAIDQNHNIILFDNSEKERRFLIRYCLKAGKHFYVTPRIEDIIMQGCKPRHLLDTPLWKYEYSYSDQMSNSVKRACDVLISLLLIVILSPLMLITAIAIKLDDGGPVFYKQTRVTKDCRIFEILKFRSMVVDAEKMGVIPSTQNDPRVTKVGRFIRAIRFDEVPQFFNILGGSMSFVGPRPERVEHVEMYTKDMPEFAYRSKVKAGLTGYAQVYGKYNTSAYDKLRLDLIYIENRTLLLDLKIVLLTIRTVFQKESTEGFDEVKSKKMNKRAAGKLVDENCK